MNRFAKRALDLCLAIIGLVLSIPFWIFLCPVIYLQDWGPVLFLQERCGKGGHSFRIIKFRTMQKPTDGKHLVLSLENDPRVTRAGRWLRTTALDELPVLINILKGDMSFVGPKPLPFIIDRPNSLYAEISQVPDYDIRIKVRPGLTGMAQVYTSKDIDHATKFNFDKLYVERMSFWLDVKLIILSFWIAFMGKWESRQKKV
ncbi:sugar transferase [Chloroflexota bacterium]